MTEENPYTGITYRKKHIYREPTPLSEEDIPDTKSEETPERGKGLEKTPKFERPDMRDKEEQAFNSLLKAINDLAKGQKEMVEAMKGMTHTTASTGKESLNGEGSNSAESSQAWTYLHNPSHTDSKMSRPNMPQFVQQAAENLTKQPDFGIPYANYMEQYQSLEQDFHAAMSFTDFCYLQLKSRPKPSQRFPRQNHELQKTLGKVTIPCFDGLSKYLARSWVQKIGHLFSAASYYWGGSYQIGHPTLGW